MLGKGDGLGPLEVGVSGHDSVGVGPGLLKNGLLEVQDLARDLTDLPAQVQPQVHGHLIVAAAGGVQALAGRADALGEQGLHVHVDVLVVCGELHPARLDVRQDGRQALLNLPVVLRGDDAAVREHPGVGHAALDVLLVEPRVKVDGRVEVVD